MVSRRKFLRATVGTLAAASAPVLLGQNKARAALPPEIQQALSIPAHAPTGTVADVQHVVIFMQENRGFDHYFGSLQGVRGFSDSRAIRATATGNTVWYQPYSALDNVTGLAEGLLGAAVDGTGALPAGSPVQPNGITLNNYVLPFHLNTTTTSGMCVGGNLMEHANDLVIWNKGNFDGWAQRDVVVNAVQTMGYYKRTDLQFYYALADAFTICDHYFSSSMTPTDSNRLFAFTGSNGLSVGQTAYMENTQADAGTATWTTYAERLETANVSWKVYQQADNFDDNALAWFVQFRNALPGSALYDKGMATVPDLVTAFANDVQQGTLPQVSWIVAPTAESEHPTYGKPADGENLTAQLLKALAANPDVWSKTVFILNYDENGGIFDHMPQPAPPASRTDGLSSVSTDGEILPDGSPIGCGFRVPLIAVSPWSRGGWVCSQVFDHTSVLRFLETRFGVQEPNISRWRRTVMGDLTSAFDFSKPDSSPLKSLPDTSGYSTTANLSCSTLPYPTIPAPQQMPVQEPGTRFARPLPYVINAQSSVDTRSGRVSIDLRSTGQAGAVFYVYGPTGGPGPWRYTVAAGSELQDTWSVNGRYDFAVHGPNGFMRRFSGSVTTSAQPEVTVTYELPGTLRLAFDNPGTNPHTIIVTDRAQGSSAPRTIEIPAGTSVQATWPLAASSNWYDLSVTLNGDDLYLRHIAGHLENGAASMTDPGVSGGGDSQASPFNPLTSVGDTVTTAVNAVDQTGGISLYAATSIAVAAGTALVAAVTGVGTAVWGFLSSTASSLVQGLTGQTSVVGSVVSVVAGAVAAVGGVAASALGAVGGALKTTGTVLVRAVNTVASAVTSIVSSVANTVTSLLGWLFG